MYQSICLQIDQSRDVLAEEMTTFIYERYPELVPQMGPEYRHYSKRDLEYHLSYLTQAMKAEDPALFSEYIVWAKSLFEGLKLPESTIVVSLESLEAVLLRHLSAAEMAMVRPFIESARQKAASAPTTAPSHLGGGSSEDALAQEYLDHLLRGDRHAASRLILDAVENGVSVRDIYLRVFQPTQREVGRLWQMNQISVAQEHFATAATQLIMSQLYPYVFNGQKIGKRMVATSVSGELHEIGVRMVADFFEMEGWDTYYLGANTPAHSVVQTVVERQPDVLSISATMTFHVDAVAEMVKAVQGQVVGKLPKILVGGYPFNVDPNLWWRVGADGYAPDAPGAVEVASRLTDRG
jgi:MerR family transcriptional regulator, light-induced transcriptional regulator